MTIQGGRGKIRVFEDFNGIIAAAATISDATALRYNELNLAAISGDTDIISTVDESGGVLSATGAGAAGDGLGITTSPVVPTSNGTLVLEARCKNSSATDFRFWCGFQQTVALAEIVNPFTLSGTTLTANAGGEVVGFYYDSAATTDDFRFMAGSNSSASTAAALDYALGGQTTLGSLGVRCNATLTADRWFVARVELDADGTARGFFGDETMANPNGMTHIATLRAGDLSTTVAYFPVVLLLASSTGDPTPEIDYFMFEANRDWDDA
jgi:hypothetical protein